MTFDEFLGSLAEDEAPVVLDPLLRALWRDAKGDWSAAHEAVSDLDTDAAARVHAYLHRKEGDLSNARYWYDRGGTSAGEGDISAEWEALVRELVARSG